MLWRNSSAVAVVAAAAVAHPGLEKLLEFHYGIGPSGVRGSIRLVFRSTDARILLFFLVGKNQISKNCQKRSKTNKNRHSIKIPYRNIPHSYPLKGAVMQSTDTYIFRGTHPTPQKRGCVQAQFVRVSSHHYCTTVGAVPVQYLCSTVAAAPDFVSMCCERLCRLHSIH